MKKELENFNSKWSKVLLSKTKTKGNYKRSSLLKMLIKTLQSKSKKPIRKEKKQKRKSKLSKKRIRFYKPKK